MCVLNQLGAWSQPTGREHELPRAGIAMRPELARSGLFNSMTGKFLGKIGRGTRSVLGSAHLIRVMAPNVRKTPHTAHKGGS
jgi:hypothetical protein